MMTKTQTTLLTLTAAALLSGCNGDEAGKATAPAVAKAQIVTLQSAPMPEQYLTSGLIASEKRAVIASRLSGYIQTIAVREGDAVKKGQLLVRIDPTDAGAAVQQSGGRLAGAEAAARSARADFDRYKALFEENAVSRQQFEQAEVRLAAAEGELKAARAGAAQAANQQRYATLTAPFAGVIVAKQANSGDLAMPGSPILTLEAPGALLVETQIDEANIGRIHVGDTAELHLAALEKRLAATVRQVVEGAGDSHTYLVKLSLPRDESLRSGMYAEVAFAVGERPALIAPAGAIFERTGMKATFVVDETDIAHYRLIRTGREWNGQVEITAGMKAGERVAISQTPLTSGMKIEQVK